MKKDARIVGLAVVTLAIIVLVLSVSYYNSKNIDTQATIDKVFDNSPQIEEEFLEPERAEGNDEPQEMKEIKIPSSGLEKKKPVSVDKIKTDDELASKLWFDIRDEDKDLNTRKNSVESFISVTKQMLESGRTPTSVSKFPYVLENKESRGFYEAFYPFPNGTVHLLTMLSPEDLGEGRITTFVTVTVDESIHTDVFRGIELVPVNEALQSVEGGTYIIVSGSKVDDNMFSEHEETGIYGFNVTASKTKLMSFSEFTDVPEGSKYSVVDNVLYFEKAENGYTPFMYTDFIDEYTTPDFINLVSTTEETNLLYKVYVRDGKIDIEFSESLE